MSDENKTEIDLTRYDGHTPGPWEASKPRMSLLWSVLDIEADLRDGAKDLIATLYLGYAQASKNDPVEYERQLANSRLIADAPALLVRVRKMEAQCLRFARAMLNHDDRGSAKCPKCWPGSESNDPEYLCPFHEAMAVIDAANAGEAGE